MKQTLVLVSDSETLHSEVQRVLTREGLTHRVERVFTEPVFLSLLAQRPEGVIADCRTRGLDGMTVLRLLRLGDPDTPLILLNDVIEEQQVVEAIRVGANRYLSTNRLLELGPAVAAELRDASVRRERARLAEALRRTEKHYQLTLEQAPVGICIVGLDLCFVEVNDRFCQIVGYSRQELIGRPVQDVSHPDDIPLSRERIRQLMAGEVSSVAFERRYVRKSGGAVWAHVRLALAHDGDTPEAVIGTVEVTTEQHEALARLTLQRLLLDSVQEAVIATDLRGIVIYWNAFAEQLYGWPASEAMGRSILDLTPSRGSREQGQNIMERLIAGGSWTGEFEVKRRDGSVFPALVTNSPLVDEEGRLVGIVGASQDISAQRAAAAELRAREIQLDEAQQVANVGSWVYDLHDQRRLWSRQMFAIHGLEPVDNPTPDLIRSVIHPEDRDQFDACIRATVEGQASSTVDYRVLRADGPRRVRLSGQVLRDAEGNPTRVAGIAQDVTDAHAATLRLEQQSAQQATVANLGHIALSRATLPLLFEVAASVTSEIMGADVCEILRWRGTKLQLAGEYGLPPHFVGGALIDGGETSQAAFVMRETDPVVIEDLRRESRFEVSPLLLGRKLVSGVSLPIEIRSGSWGIFSVYFSNPRRPTINELQFLRGVATILGHGIERRSAEEELLTRSAQQSAVASLGQHALSAVNSATFDVCCSLIRETLDLDFAAFLKVVSARDKFVVGGESPPNFPQPDVHIQAAFALTNDLVLNIPDYKRETRFDSEVTIQSGVRSGFAVPVRSGLHRFGVIEGGTLDPRHFSDTDLQFVQAMATVLAEALEREAATQALVDSEARYREVFEGASEIIYTVSPEGVITSLNPAFEAITGWQLWEWTGKQFLGLIPEEEHPVMQKFFAAVVGDRQVTTTDVFVIARNGTRIQLEATSFPKIINGEVREVYGFARDVTVARRAEQQRARAARELERLLESTAEGIYAVDITGRCTMVNRAALEMLGYDRQEWIGHNVHELLHATHADGTPYPQILCPVHGSPSNVVANQDELFRRRDGSMLPIVCTASEIRENDRVEGYVVTFNDVTERRRMQLQIEQGKRLTSLGRLAATIAHEFNNVLMGIAPFVDLLRRETSSSRGMMALDQMAKSVGRGKGITEEILRFTRSADPVLEAIDTKTWLQTVGNEAETVVGPGYRVEVYCSDQVAPLLGDAHQLHQSLMNLVINARDAMPSGGTISLSAEQCEADGDYPFGLVANACDYVHLTVRDDGPGIAPEVREHIFEPLFTTKKHGTGLGLAVMHQAVLRHSGEVFVESEVGKGTAFHLFIPAAKADGPQPPKLTPHQSQSRFRSVLLVEDEPAVSLGLSTLLREEGLRVEVAETGRAALASIDRQPPDLVVLDLGLPDMDGEEVYQHIAQRHPRLPVLFSTGHGDRAKMEGYLAHPHVGFLMKPYDADTFFQALETLQPAASTGIEPEAIMHDASNLTSAELDLLPFGIIHLDRDGIVTAYNEAEERLAHRSRRDTIGKHFFKEVAPCTQVRQFFGAFQTGIQHGELNEVFDFSFPFPEGTREVRVRMLYHPAPAPGVWIFVTPRQPRAVPPPTAPVS